MRKNHDTIIGSGGSKLSLADLPSPNTVRWIPRRKAEIVAAVRGGLLSLDEARNRYDLTIGEFTAWQRAVEQFGVKGLRVTQPRDYRRTAFPEP